METGFYSREELSLLQFKKVADTALVSKKATFYGTNRIEIGPYSRIDDFCVLSAGKGGIKIGRNVHIAVFCSILGGGQIKLMDFCNLSTRVSVFSSNDDFTGRYMTNPTVPSPYTLVDSRDVTCERHVIIGSGSVILPGVVIGEGTAIGALSLVKNTLSSFGVYAGNPLAYICRRDNRLLSLEKEYLGLG